ncbi:hypothetical protein TNCV_1051391 [Trichonephila clavipes]|nr:hypothetical protein TNCV_1051391 [Trichonephila clavipes]
MWENLDDAGTKSEVSCDIGSDKSFSKNDTEECMTKKKLNLQKALNLLQNLASERSDALTDDSSDEEIPTNKLLEFS